MNRYLFDTSAFTKRYHPEVGAGRIHMIFQQPAATFRISNLTVLETQPAFAMKVRSLVIPEATATSLMDKVFADIAVGLISTTRITSGNVDSARNLVQKYGYTRRLRTLDSLQLAVAIDLHQHAEIDTFVVADKLLAEIAKLEGLTVENPEEAP